ncbi:MAG: cyclase family protein [Clostridiales bacterium]|nr:cyclase family protein [Clostridiales bacterium]
MKLLDISRELTRAPVYPGDPPPVLRPLSHLALGDVCNLTAVDMCLHNGTHLDAPLHFLPDGGDAAQTPLDVCVGECYVVDFEGVLLGAQAEQIIERLHPERLLFRGRMEISPSAAFVLSGTEVKLVGVEAPSVAPPESAAAVHRQLLGGGVYLLEGLDLSAAREGYYFLFAAPLKIAGADGAPVRAVLLERTLSV